MALGFEVDNGWHRGFANVENMTEEQVETMRHVEGVRHVSRPVGVGEEELIQKNQTETKSEFR